MNLLYACCMLVVSGLWKLLFRYLLPFHKRLHAFSPVKHLGAGTILVVARAPMEFLLILQKMRLGAAICARMNYQGYLHVHIFICAIRLSCTAKWFPMSIAKETSTVVKEDSLLLQLLKVKGE